MVGAAVERYMQELEPEIRLPRIKDRPVLEIKFNGSCVWLAVG